MAKFPYPYKVATFADNYHDVALLLLRIGLSSVTLYFGITGLLDPNTTLAWIAPTLKTMISQVMPFNIFAFILTLSQTIVGLLILTGLFTRILGIGAFFMMIGIVANLLLFMPLNDIVMRDIALASANLALFFFGPGKYSLDRQFEIE